jgi:hypothetical protein
VKLRRNAAQVAHIFTDVDHQLQRTFIGFTSRDGGSFAVQLDYKKLKDLEDYCRRVRQTFDHANNIAKERQQQRVGNTWNVEGSHAEDG